MLTVHIDFSGIDGFLCLAPTFKLIDELGIEVQWLPVSGIMNRVSGKQPEESAFDPLAEYKERRRKARFAFETRELQRNCERLGISEAQGTRTFDATCAHLGLLYLLSKNIDPRDYIEAVYHAVYVEDQNLEGEDAVSALLNSLGVEPGFSTYLETGKEELEQLQQKLLDQGVFNSPAYLLDDQLFQGRQHLPLIRWHLEGGAGPAPV